MKEIVIMTPENQPGLNEEWRATVSAFAAGLRAFADDIDKEAERDHAACIGGVFADLSDTAEDMLLVFNLFVRLEMERLGLTMPQPMPEN